MTGYVPILVGVITSVLTVPGTASCFWPNSGTQNEWMHVASRAIVELDRLGRPGSAEYAGS